jgi:hypothetical protein
VTTLTPAQVAGYVIQAGFKGSAAIDAISVALAESGGRTDAVNVNGDKWKSRDRGLFQINSHWHPEVSDAQAFDPKAATAAAYKISHAGADWSAWSTWPVAAAAMRGRATIAVQQYLSGVAHGLVGGGITLNPLDAGTFHDPTGVLDKVGSTAQAVGQIAVILAHAGQWVADPHNMLRIVMVAGGAVATVVALVLLAESGAAGSTAQSASRTTVDAAKLAALA